MGQYEVTHAEYQALIGATPSRHIGPDHPVEMVSRNDADAYCAALTLQETALGNVPAGFEYRLPTEAEWEYACRAGTTTEFNTGADLYCADAHIAVTFHGNSVCAVTSTADVGSYPANAWGLYDMHGNVFEWCLDTYAAYGAAAVTDPYVTSGLSMIYRGGSWVNDSSMAWSAWRGSLVPTYTWEGLGFRVVLAPVLP